MKCSSSDAAHRASFFISMALLLTAAIVCFNTVHRPLPDHQMGRRLLETKEKVMNGLEGVPLEPLTGAMEKHCAQYLPDLTGDSLDGYSRRVFVEVVQPGRSGSGSWFERNYPRRGKEFEMIRLEAVATEAVEGGMVEWMEGNVREEEFVVVKAEAEVVEEMVRRRVLRLVDELFLECDYEWERRGVRRRAYWECVALYGRVRDQGVVVHQWWVEKN